MKKDILYKGGIREMNKMCGLNGLNFLSEFGSRGADVQISKKGPMMSIRISLFHLLCSILALYIVV